MTGIEPHHIRLQPEDVHGNGDLGRLFFLPGSASRARHFAEYFLDRRVVETPRHVDTWLGRYTRGGVTIDVGATSTGMGPPSLNIVVSELMALGARRFLRVGSAGSLQPDHIHPGDVVIATAAVRDERTSDMFTPREYPAASHPDWVRHLRSAALNQGHGGHTYPGLVHSKCALYGRELAKGPQAEENAAYMELLSRSGVLASEMEASHLFVLCGCEGPDIRPLDRHDTDREAYKAGAILAIIGGEALFATADVAREAEDRAIRIALEAAVHLVAEERGFPVEGTDPGVR